MSTGLERGANLARDRRLPAIEPVADEADPHADGTIVRVIRAASEGELSELEARHISGLEERIAAQSEELTRRAQGQVSTGPAGVRYLFVAGCPRSGTTALATLLNHDPRFLLGQERYRRVRRTLEPYHFSEEIFFNPTTRETSWAMPWRGERVWPGTFAEYQELRERWRGGGVEVVGDKAPYYTREFDRLSGVFPGARFVVLVRALEEVARSYQRRAEDPVDHWPAENGPLLAVKDWNAALEAARAFSAQAPDGLLLISYDRFFFGAPGELDRLYGFVGLDVSPAVPPGPRGRRDRGPPAARRRPADPAPLPTAVIDQRRDDLEAWAQAAAIQGHPT